MTFLEYLLSEEDADFYGVSGASLVLNPAHKSEAVAMSEPDNILFTATGNDRVVKGLFVRAGVPVKQKYGGGQYSKFEADTIKRMRDRFHKSGADKNITINHEKEDGKPVYQDDCHVVESYIVANKHDIASLAEQGVADANIGDWVLGVKVSEDVWENDVKTGEVRGLSLEGFFNAKMVEASEYDKQIAKANALAQELFKEYSEWE